MVYTYRRRKSHRETSLRSNHQDSIMVEIQALLVCIQCHSQLRQAGTFHQYLPTKDCLYIPFYMKYLLTQIRHLARQQHSLKTALVLRTVVLRRRHLWLFNIGLLDKGATAADLLEEIEESCFYTRNNEGYHAITTRRSAISYRN